MSGIRCNYLNCYAGQGVAGNGVCFLKGNPIESCCGKFKTTDKGMLEHAESEIDKLRSEMSNWISVKDLPKENKEYIVYDGQSERVGIRCFEGMGFHSLDSDGEDGMLGINITHWMPKPEPPMEG